MRRYSFTQIQVLVGLLVMAVALPVATKLVQNNQDTRNKAATAHCVGEGGMVANGTAGCCDGLTKQNCGGSGSFTYCYCKGPVNNPLPTPVLNYVPTGALCGGMFVVGNTCSYCEFGTETNWLGQQYCNRIQYLKVATVNNRYIFSLMAYPDGAVGNMIQELQKTTGKSSFSIVVDLSTDPYLSLLLKDVLNSLPQDFQNKSSKLATSDRLGIIVNSINSTIKARNISYYPWSQSTENLKKYVSDDTQLLGSRINKGYFTCFETALLAKTVLSKLGMPTNFSYAGIHLYLKYKDASGKVYDVDPLRSMYL